jgi:NAD(P)-dependent dehydrogenase (short-subunit alcohol dehydrogenase family)
VAFSKAGARHVVVSDIDLAAAQEVASQVSGSAYRVDVSSDDELTRMIGAVQRDVGAIDVFCSNAGILPLDPHFDAPEMTPDAIWQRTWDINVMAHVRAARAVLPSMIERRQGHLLQTISAAGLLTMIGSAAYSATKHAAMGFAESLAIAHRDHGIGISVLAPQAVDTEMTRGKSSFGAELNGIISADMVAAAALVGLREERFLILPHAEVADHVRSKAVDPERWIAALARLRGRYAEDAHVP